MSKKWTEDEVLKVLAIMNSTNVESLDKVITFDAADDLVELKQLVADPGPGPQEIAEQHELHRILVEAIDRLDPRHRQVLLLRYGLESGKPMTLEQVGQQYGVTRERIRQLEAAAIKKLRHILLTKYKIKEIL